jgi:hypothetical protein
VDDLTFFHGSGAEALIGVVLVIGLWSGAIFAIDYWVRSKRRHDRPPSP